MCIRDRVRAGQLLAEMDPVDLDQRLASTVAAAARAKNAVAVSYTHLRAHETVLDIVCRLLLEKKQHTTTTHNTHTPITETQSHLIKNTITEPTLCNHDTTSSTI